MFKYTRKHDLLLWQFAFYILSEIAAMSLFFTLFAKFFPRQGVEPRDILTIFEESAKNTAWVLLLPYSISWLYFSWREKNRLLESISNAIPEAEIHKRNLIAFPDEKGEIKISVMLENLLYVESSDNYATIHYLNKAKLSHYLIRNSLKWMEENLTKETPLVRCHRSFIVNLDKVKVLRKTKDGIFLEMDALNTPDIQVSKTYYERVMDKFSKYSI